MSRTEQSLQTVFVIVALLFLRAAYGTHISTFTDDQCQDSFRDLNGPNGYPNGTCTHLNVDGPFKSFMVTGMDPGCTVTIYGKDTTPDICSATALKFADLATCYNASWVYYSIDECTPPSQIQSGSSPSSTSSIASSSTASSSTSYTTSSSTSSSISATTTLPVAQSTAPVSTSGNLPTNAPIPLPSSSSQPQTRSKSHTAALVGGVVGGAAIACICVVFATYCLYRRRVRRLYCRTSSRWPAARELADNGLLEADVKIPAKAQPRYELSDRYTVPIELSGDIRTQYDDPIKVANLPSELYGNQAWLGNAPPTPRANRPWVEILPNADGSIPEENNEPSDEKRQHPHD